MNAKLLVVAFLSVVALLAGSLGCSNERVETTAGSSAALDEEAPKTETNEEEPQPLTLRDGGMLFILRDGGAVYPWQLEGQH